MTAGFHPSLLLQGAQQQSGPAPITVTPGAASFLFSTQAATVAVGAVIVASGFSSLQLSSQAPSLSTPVSVLAGAASELFTADESTLFTPRTVTTSISPFQFGAQTPTVSIGGVLVQADDASWIWTASDSTTRTTVTATVSSFQFAATAPMAQVGVVTAIPSASPFQFAATAPTAQAGVATAIPSASPFQFAATAPTAQAGVATAIPSASPWPFTVLAPTSHYVPPGAIVAETASWQFAVLASSASTKKPKPKSIQSDRRNNAPPPPQPIEYVEPETIAVELALDMNEADLYERIAARLAEEMNR